MVTQLPLEPNPPVEPSTTIDDAPTSAWPTVIGSLSLVYGFGGMLCAMGIAASGFLTDAMMSMAGMKVDMPLALKIINGGFGFLLLIAGVILIVGSIGTLRRKRSGPSTVRAWVIYRIVIVLLGAVTTILTEPAQVQFQRSMLDAQRQKIKESGSTMVIPDVSDDQLWRRTILTIGITSVVFSAYPLFLGIFLSRRKIMQEISEWP